MKYRAIFWNGSYEATEHSETVTADCLADAVTIIKQANPTKLFTRQDVEVMFNGEWHWATDMEKCSGPITPNYK